MAFDLAVIHGKLCNAALLGGLGLGLLGCTDEFELVDQGSACLFAERGLLSTTQSLLVSVDFDYCVAYDEEVVSSECSVRTVDGVAQVEASAVIQTPAEGSSGLHCQDLTVRCEWPYDKSPDQEGSVELGYGGNTRVISFPLAEDQSVCVQAAE